VGPVRSARSPSSYRDALQVAADGDAPPVSLLHPPPPLRDGDGFVGQVGDVGEHELSGVGCVRDLADALHLGVGRSESSQTSRSGHLYFATPSDSRCARMS